jgi:hypothetical protein
MVERQIVNGLRALVSIRQAQARAASEQAVQALANCDTAQTIRDQRAVQRDEAGGIWLRNLGAARPQPELVRLSALWLIEQEQQLSAEELNLSIAKNRLQLAQNAFSEALASEAGSIKVSAKARKDMDKYLEERQSNHLADSWLWRRQA